MASMRRHGSDRRVRTASRASWTPCFIVALGVVSGLSASCWACEPCPRILGLEETAQRADIVLIGRKVKEGPRSNPARAPGGPEWIDVAVEQVLKGTVSAKTIHVNSWDGMCQYGIVMGADTSVLFLRAPVMRAGRIEYGSVDNGCSVTALPMRDGQVIVKTQAMSIETLQALWRSVEQETGR